jgi:hypothetical protein
MDLKECDEPDGNIAELSRPARAITKNLKAQSAKVQGKKRDPQSRSAKYHNWMAPFLWQQIALAAKDTGPKMSQTEIVRTLKHRDPITFAGLWPTAVGGWIDRSGTQAR